MGVIDIYGIFFVGLQVDVNGDGGVCGSTPCLVRVDILTTHDKCPETFCYFRLTVRTFFGTAGCHQHNNKGNHIFS